MGDVEKSHDLFKRAKEIWKEQFAAGDRPDREQVTVAYIALERVLRAYCRPSNWPDGYDGRPHEDVPPEIAAWLADQIQSLHKGSLPGPMTELIRPGAPKIRAAENRDIGFAVAYIRAAKDGLIKDRSYRKTIAELYAVRPETVNRWCRKHPDTQLSDFFSHAQGDEERATLILDAVRECGDRYQKAGRSSEGRSKYRHSRRKPRGDIPA
jgi:hypothetical protein